MLDRTLAEIRTHTRTHSQTHTTHTMAYRMRHSKDVFTRARAHTYRYQFAIFIRTHTYTHTLVHMHTKEKTHNVPRKETTFWCQTTRTHTHHALTNMDARNHEHTRS
eukprot:GDKI01030042.1.p1 GENE.GDKI01030042.1~~GDKI01030042.1.p1  ORF type:complete len:107 (-),score=35.50 GDKI01030042.1:24-344(-)